jgi:hypothetical protein
LNRDEEYEGEEVTEEGVVGAVLEAVVFCCVRYRRGDDGRRVREKLPLVGNPRTGELLLSRARGVQSSG